MRGARSSNTAWATGPPGSSRALMFPSVEEVPGAGEVERGAGGAARLDRLVVADRSAGLDDGANARLEQHLRAVGEREEGVARGDRPLRPVTGTAHGKAGRVDAVDLTHADAYRRAAC